MEAWISLALGPLFRVSLAVCLLGLGYHLFNALWMVYQSHERAADKDLPLGRVLSATALGLLPSGRRRPLQTVASVAVHAGLLLVPLFSIGHASLWQPSVGTPWPTIGPLASDALTLAAIFGLLAILLVRWFDRTSRALTRGADTALLVMLLGLAGSGYWVAHPLSSPLAPRTMLLAHALLGDLALVLTPLTRLAHCVLALLTPLLSEVAWHFPAESGAHVALALGKENDPI